MNNDELFPKYSDLDRNTKIQALMGWTAMVVIGVVCYKAGQHNVRKSL